MVCDLIGAQLLGEVDQIATRLNTQANELDVSSFSLH
jgi:hypothetical protein